MSQQLISRSEDLRRLRDEGYNVEVRSDGYLVIRDVPYVTAARVVRSGVLVSKLALAGDITTTPDDHTVRFAGERPCDQHGTPLAKIINSEGREVLADGLEVDFSFSSKPPGRNPPYNDYYVKMVTYVSILLGPAQAIARDATAQTYPVIEEIDDESVFRYIDTATSRAQITAATKKLEISRIAIVGLGGTGSYVLDLVAKTPVREIHLFDGDVFLQHNAFRSPGAASVDQLQAKWPKVEYFREKYSAFRNGIVAHSEYVDRANLDALDEMDFVFLCLDGGGSRLPLVDYLERINAPFVDVGMGIYHKNDSLGGLVRTTTSTPEYRGARARMQLADAELDDDYSFNIQSADLNALNAALAVIRWKKHCGYYLDFDCEHHSIYTIDGNHVVNEELGNAS